MLTQTQVQKFETDGYLRGGSVLSEDQVGVLQEEVERVIRERDRTDIPQPVLCHNMTGDLHMTGDLQRSVWQVVDIWMASAPYRALIANPTIVEEMAQLTHASALRIWHDQIQYKPASKGGVNMWHQDAPLWPILAPMTEVSAWVALDDVDPENGCMSMVPGSHLWGNHIDFLTGLKQFDEMPESFEGHAVEVRPCPVRRGEVHYHHAMTWHGSPANSSGRPRRAVALHYMTQETRFVASGEHVMKPYVEVPDGEVMRGQSFPLVFGK